MDRGWESIGGRPGGTASAVAVVGDRSPVAFAATPVGVFASDDAGSSWSPAGIGKTGPLVEAVAPSPAFGADRTLFAGGRDGLYRSNDGGAGWRRVLAVGPVTAVVVSPAYGQDATLLVGTESDGVLRSADAGQSWDSVNPGLLDTRVLALALSGDFANDRTAIVATLTGLYRSRNGGKVWRQVWPERGEAAVQCLAVSHGSVGLGLAGTVQDGLLRSVDGGTTWEQVSGLDGEAVTALAISPGGAVAAATADGVSVSRDQGRSWRHGGQVPGPVLSLGFVPGERGETLLAGLLGHGVARSTDYGAGWEGGGTGLYGKLPGGLALSPAFAADRTLYCFGPDDGMARSRDGGTNWRDVGPGGAVAGVALSDGYPADGTVYCAGAAGLYVSRDGSASWVQAIGVAATAVATSGATVLAALEGGELVTSGDGGRAWSSAGRLTDAGEIASVHLSREGAMFAVAGAPDGRHDRHSVWRSAAVGGRWDRWLEERSDGTPALAAPSATAGTVFVGLQRAVLTPIPNFHEVRGRVRVPVWRRVELGDATVTALVASPAYDDDRTLFAATSGGVYVSRDSGASFGRWDQNGDPVPMVSLAPTASYATDKLVYAVGLGGSLWRRRDS